MLRLLKLYSRLMRLHQPVGVFLLLWPCWWAIALATDRDLSAKLLVLFGIGAVIMRGAGCIVNDIIDRDFDRNVERTRTRPLASGEVTLYQAFVLLSVLLAGAFCVVLAMNVLVLILAAVSLLLVASYPFMKRITWWPQAFLGITFNWGALMGWAAVKDAIELPAILLYAGCIFWTLGYDTIYAHMDKRDDALIGIKSTALKLGQRSKPWIAAFYSAAVVFWILAGHGAYYYLGLSLVAAHFIWQVRSVNINDPVNCMKVFRSNSVLGLLMFLSICLK